MGNHNHQINKEKFKHSSADWNGLGNEPRNDNLTKIRGLGSFERKEIVREKEKKLNPVYPLNGHTNKATRG